MMSGDDVLTMGVARRIEIFTGAGRRRRWSAETKALIVAESYATSVGEAAARHGVAKNQLFSWRRDARRAAGGDLVFAPVVVDEAPSASGPAQGGVIEIEFGGMRVRIGRGVEARLAVAVLGALRGGR